MKRITVGDLEQFTSHELADLLANVVLVLRKMPDVPVKDLQPVEKPPVDADQIAANVRKEKMDRHADGLPDWIEEAE